MYKKIIKVNNNGFTLIEIIASIAILGMVIAVFLPIFPQILQWSNHTDDELVASNLLGQVAYDLENTSDLRIGDVNQCPEHTTYKGQSDLGDLATYELNNRKYHIELDICKEVQVNLYRTNIRIFSTNNKLVTESFTYIGEGNE